MGGGKGGGDTETVIRHAPYVETMHRHLIYGGNVYNPTQSLLKAFLNAWDASPYADREDIVVENGFLGSGYTIDQFPSLFDMFGKFMAGLDIETLWTQVHSLTTEGPEINDIVQEFDRKTQENRDQISFPALHAGMRDIQAVNSSAFVMGRALIESKRVAEVSGFEAKVRYQALQLAADRWKMHLSWNQQVMAVYSTIMELFYTASFDADKLNYKYKESDELWNLRLFDFVGSFLGAIGGGTPVQNSDGPSKVATALGGAASGFATGLMATGGNPIGGAVGGVVGLAAGLF